MFKLQLNGEVGGGIGRSFDFAALGCASAEGRKTKPKGSILVSLNSHGFLLKTIVSHNIKITLEYDSAIKKNGIMPFAATWMQLEIIILSEVSQRKTNMISLICGI